jgi:Ca-activated chloride channel homolog
MLVATIATIHVLSDAELATWGGSPVPSCPMMMASHAGQAAVGFPLQAMDIDVTAVGITATIELMQQFVNRSAVPMEATYIFPMPDRMAVRRFRMECNGRVIEGTIDERGAARAQYDHAIAQGQRAAIAEEERPGVFTMRVGNIMPGEAPIVRLSLVGPLGVDDGEVTLHFPLLVAPRYTAGNVLGGPQAGDGTAQDTDAVPDASRVAPPVRIAGHGQAVRLSGRVSIHGGQAGVSSVSTSLPMVVSPTDGTMQLNLANGQQLNRDLIVRWQLAGAAMSSTLTCVDDTDGAAGTFSLLVIPPTSTAMAQRPRDVVFIVDRSGSMQGWQMVAARRAVARMVDTLNHHDRFAVMAFDDRIEQPTFDGGRALVVATDRNRFVAVEFLAKVDARGGTHGS